MKTKVILILIGIILLYLAYIFVVAVNNEEKLYASPIPKTFITCTSAKFLLSEVDTTRQIAPLFDNLGNHHFKISTSEESAQGFFDHGLNLAYAFNHAEAHRSLLRKVYERLGEPTLHRL